MSMSTPIAHSHPNHQHHLAQSNAAHFDAIVHEHAHSHHVKHIAEKIAEKIVQLLGIRSQDEQAHGDDHDDDHNADHADHDGPSEGITVLDYACGAGAMTWALFDKLDGKWKQFVGVDISPKSVDLYNQKAATQFTPEEMQAVCTELNGHPGELSGNTFDVIVCSQAYHHFADVNGITRILASFLKPGGTLFVADHMAHDGTLFKPEHDHSFAAAAHTVSHRSGFAEEEMKFIFEQGGGLQDFRWLPNVEAVGNKSGTKRVEIFLATGTKPPSLSAVDLTKT